MADPGLRRASRSTARRGTARLPAGVGFDPGGIGKGFAADLVAAEAMDAGAAGVLVDLGGDLRVAGRPPGDDRAAGSIGVDHPTADRSIALGPTDRRCRRHQHARHAAGGPPPTGERHHHLIDPLLGQPIDTDVLSATAVAAEGWQAEVLAKAAFIGGRCRAWAWSTRSAARRWSSAPTAR